MSAVATHCPYCSLQCGITLTPTDAGVELAGREDFPVNRGGLCMKGAHAAELLDHPERLTAPLVRDSREEPFRDATWEEALDRVAAAILETRTRYGRDAVGCFGGGGLTNEKAYQLGKFARVALRSASIDYNGRFCMSSAAAAGTRAFGLDRGLPFPLADIPLAETVLLVGSNPADTMPPAMRFFEEGRTNGARHIVVDPRRTVTAEHAHRHLQPVPGTDLSLASGLLHIAVTEGLIDEHYVATRTSGFDAVRRAVRAYWPDRVERTTGVSVEDMRATVHDLARSRTAMILTARGVEQHADGTDTAQAWINLALALGLPGRGPGSGWGTVTGQGNGQGGREHGQKADQLPGYRKLADPEARAHVAAVWGVDPDELPGPGVSAYELLDGLGEPGGVRCLLLAASNPVVSAPNARHVTRRLQSLDFLCVTDFFLSESARLADVVLPTTQWAEEEGTMTNVEGRVLVRRRAVAPPTGVRSDLEIWHELAARLGRGDHFATDPWAVADELRRASAGGLADYGGITRARLEAGEELFWPCPDEEHPGTPRMFLERFATPDGLARFIPVRSRIAQERPDETYPYLLTTGRSRAQYQSGTQTRRSPTLNAAAPEAYAELHPELARRIGVADGDLVRLRSPRGSTTVRAWVTAAIRRDTVFVPFHWGGEACVNALTSDALDPTSRMPEFKTCPVAVEALAATADDVAPDTARRPA
ncbi:molybdopterin oxidoreductase family protein [Pseudonocardia sp. WMMC193]|uniref:molybdopterin oxidoreductase family protein n=1 Tax=Pseudonocardia sp. WMMC193 TaxID=2911965 RepID=UPI001F16F701|nr:molybdopterin oxidoreductase family protein [Pseudonocardia sp. WMMC193]MCF7553678.1 molybdopterin oxidoreductase family protein [Pseudonocardia sp. WMMC193]